MSARFRRIVAELPVELLALCFQEKLSPVSPARSVNLPVQPPAGSVNHSLDGVMLQLEPSQIMGRTTPSQIWLKA
jgi:hypothetical protein